MQIQKLLQIVSIDFHSYSSHHNHMNKGSLAEVMYLKYGHIIIMTEKLKESILDTQNCKNIQYA